MAYPPAFDAAAVLAEQAHRPWPVPDRPWLAWMRWDDLLFAHWPVDADVLRPHVPDGLAIDEHDGTAWVSVVPFTMETGFRGGAAIPGHRRFPELNVRTYVMRHGRPGIWFFSLDADSRPFVLGARATFGLPYFAAAMRHEEHRKGSGRQGSGRQSRGGARRDAMAGSGAWRRLGARTPGKQRADVAGRPSRFDSRRRDGKAAFRAQYAPHGPARTAEEGLERFLAERYALYARYLGRIVRGDIHHPPWRIRDASGWIDASGMTPWAPGLLAGPPASMQVADRQDVLAWRPVPT